MTPPKSVTVLAYFDAFLGFDERWAQEATSEVGPFVVKRFHYSVDL